MPPDHWDGHRRMRIKGIDIGLTTSAQAHLTAILSGSKIEMGEGGGIVTGYPL